MDERYVIGKDFNTKDWWVFDNELGLRICYFDTEEEAKEWVKRKTKGEQIKCKSQDISVFS